ncbi:Lipase 1 [Erysiphe neolycopersici]|uniref:Carboxylic ester hydrolase n=1 Tax=Erysiphe neolycopersici TaxID=212602 RepID=A0A420HQM9_9PEZI|nr:Lipase 1 [Erysiphe neolycopersici]
MNFCCKKWVQTHRVAMIYFVLTAIVCLGSTQAILFVSNNTKEIFHPVVDVGYSVYRGYRSEALQLDYFNGIRYAAPPIGRLRWQKPQEPQENRTKIIPAVNYSQRCPQSYQGPRPKTWFFLTSDQISEDCLFLNIIRPIHAKNLPVFVWFHGGGYGLGDGRYNFTEFVTSNTRNFIVVTLQYRLGAFGFLSSSELTSFGIPNAGLYDQHFALEWIQKHISKFGGDPRRVTIAGDSAGAGSVMQQTLAYGGSEGTKYFNNAIVASPYYPPQWHFDDDQPTKAYNEFKRNVGCEKISENITVFECLSSKDTYSLQNASAYVSTGANYGQWAFLPVIDTAFIIKSPLDQLHNGEVNGLRLLSGHNSDEAPAFVPQVIQNVSDFNSYLQSLFPSIDQQLHAKISNLYAIPDTIPGPLFSTLGSSGPSALNQSTFATGQQQRANNLYAESTFVCPSYWLADAFSNLNKKSWKYQFSVPPAAHGTDMNAYYMSNAALFSEGTLSDGFRTGVQLSWGQFIINNDPTLPHSVIDEFSTNTNRKHHENLSAALNTSWVEWDKNSMNMLNFNSSGGTEKTLTVIIAVGKFINVTMNVNPGLTANWTIADAATWENGRGKRCNFWSHLKKYRP